MKAGSIRWRLALGNGAVLFLLLAGLSGYLYYSYRRSLIEGLDDELKRYAQMAARNIVEEHLERSRGEEAEEDPENATENILFPRRLGQRLSAEGRVLAHSGGPELEETALLKVEEIAAALAGQPVIRTLDAAPFGGLRLYAMAVPAVEEEPATVVAVAEPLTEIEEALRRLRWQVFWAIPLAVALAMAAAYLMARRNLAPIRKLVNGVQAISGVRRLDQRLPVENPKDELGELALTFNDFLGQLQRGVENERRFVGDASHELRTPLTILQGELEVALRKNRTAAEYRGVLQVAHEETLRLSRLVERLLQLSRLGSPGGSRPRQEVCFDETVQRTCQRLQALAKRKELKLDCAVQPGLRLLGDADELDLLAENLVENAISYTPVGGTVEVEARRAGKQVVFRVRDTGVGIPADQIPKIFDRFYRADASRSGADNHTGLGLSLVQAVAEAHQAEISVESRPGEGSCFTVLFPLANSSGQE